MASSIDASDKVKPSDKLDKDSNGGAKTSSFNPSQSHDGRSVWDLGYLRIKIPHSNRPKTIPIAAFKPNRTDGYSDYIRFQHDKFLACLRSYHVFAALSDEHTLIYRGVNGTEFDLLDGGGYHCALGDWGSRPLPPTGLLPLDITLTPTIQSVIAPDTNLSVDVTSDQAVQQGVTKVVTKTRDPTTEQHRRRMRRRECRLFRKPSKQVISSLPAKRTCTHTHEESEGNKQMGSNSYVDRAELGEHVLARAYEIKTIPEK